VDESSAVIRQRREKAKALSDRGINPNPNEFKSTQTIKPIKQSVGTKDWAEDDSPAYATAGRIVGLRSFGKATFLHFRDYTGQLQAYVKRDEVGEEAYAWFKQLDVGDFIGIKGPVFQTKTGEWTIQAQEIQLLCKAVRPLPEKFHGLRDPEKRYRQRYLDLIMNPDVREIFINRGRIIQAFRDSLLERGFLEVETPMMQPIPGGG